MECNGYKLNLFLFTKDCIRFTSNISTFRKVSNRSRYHYITSIVHFDILI